ncbi:hypothetical protein LTS17_003611 [Exophiala oligosperma]
MEVAKTTRNRAPPKEEWERIKPELKRLLIDEKLTLKETARYLAALQNFHASIDMYKLRLKKWGLQKYFKKIELAAAADSVRPFYKSGIAAPRPTVGQREVPIDRMKRHFPESFRAATRQNYSSGNQLGRPTSAYQRAVDKTMQGRRQISIPRVTLQVSPGISYFEKTGYQIHSYYSWKLTKEKDRFREPFDVPTPREFHNLALSISITFGAKSPFLIQLLLKELFTMTAEVVAAQHLDLLRVILSICSGAFYSQADRFWNTLLQYIYTVAKKSLSTMHPVLMLLDLRRHDLDTNNIPYSVFLELIRELALQQHNPPLSYLYDIDFSMTMAIEDEQGLEAACEFCSDRLNHYTGRFSEAEEICRELVDVQVPPESDCADVQFEAMSLLADLLETYEDYSEAAFWYRRASAGFEKLFGSENAKTQLCLYQANQLEATLQYISENNTRAIEQQESEEERRRAEQLEFAIDQLGEEMSRVGLDTGNDDIGSEGTIWSEDGASIGGGPTDIHACPINGSNAMNVAEVEGDFIVNCEQHNVKELPSSLETFQVCLVYQNGGQTTPNGVDELLQNSSAHFSSVESTSCHADTWTTIPSIITTNIPGDEHAGCNLNLQQRESTSRAQFVESAARSNPTMNNLCALDPIDWEPPVLGDNEDFDDSCRMPYLDQQSEFTCPFTGLDTSNTLDINTTEVATKVSSEVQIHIEEPLNFDNVVNDSDWLNNFLLPDIQTDSDLPVLGSYTDTTMMELVDWQ